jgi:hypothetical protein
MSAPAPPRIAGLVARAGDLEPGEALIDRVFATVRASLDAADASFADVDSVVLAADDVTDGRSITTMIHATAAGAYRRDELRVTQGSLTALGLAGLRVSSGMSELSIVASWWAPTADPAEIARAGVDPRDGARALLPPERFAGQAPRGGCAACLVRAGGGGAGELALEGFTWGQAGYREWLARDGEPEGVLRRLGTGLRERCALPAAGGAFAASATGAAGSWAAAKAAAGIGEQWRSLEDSDVHHGIADGLISLARMAPALAAGEAGVVMATGSPPFALAEAALVRRTDA